MLNIFDDMKAGRFQKTKLIAEMDSTAAKLVPDQDEISMENIPIVTPNGDVLVKSMTLNLYKCNPLFCFMNVIIFLRKLSTSLDAVLSL